MPTFLPFLGVFMAGVAIYELWTARTQGKLHGYYGGMVYRKNEPITFWIYVTLLIAILCMLAAFAVFWIYVALARGVDWSPGSDFIRPPRGG